MKKSVKIIAVAMAALMLCMALVSCGKTLKGEYENENGTVTYEFNGKNVKVTAPKSLLSGLTGEKVVYEGTYEIEDDLITFTFVDEDGEEIDCIYAGTYDFKEADNGDITIGKTEYEKAD